MRKENKQYVFTVEGKTEMMYLQHLQRCINQNKESKYTVVIKSTIEDHPSIFWKNQNAWLTPKVVHFCDIESNDEEHQKKLQGILTEMATAQKGNKITYAFGYSNFTFELWMILHKTECFSSFANRNQYLAPINKAFGENFSKLDEFKQENNLARCLAKITLDDIKKAIERAEIIEKKNKEYNKETEFRGYKYYKNNPSLNIGTFIREILKECGLMAKQ